MTTARIFTTSTKFILGSAVALALYSSQIYASGFQLFEYSGAGVGNFDAAGAVADDATIATTNAAGMAVIDKPTLALSGMGIFPNGNFTGTACGGIGCVPLPTKGNGAQGIFVPALQIVVPVKDRFDVGLSITSPFGLQSNWGKFNNLSNSATKSKIEVIDIDPSMAFKITHKLSVGAGVDVDFMNAVLNQQVGVIPDLPLLNADANNQAQNWGVGWNAGGLYQFSKCTRIGASYHSQVTERLNGTSNIENGILLPLTSFHLNSTINLPGYAMGSAYHAFNPTWSVMGTAVYTDWHSIQKVQLNNAVIPSGAGFLGLGTVTGTTVLPTQFQSTWHFAGGANYVYNQYLSFTAGGGYDRTPTNTATRTIRLPDGSRYDVSVGAKLKFSQHVSIDGGYSHIFIAEGNIDQIGLLNKSIGKTDNYADLVGVQLNVSL